MLPPELWEVARPHHPLSTPGRRTRGVREARSVSRGPVPPTGQSWQGDGEEAENSGRKDGGHASLRGPTGLRGGGQCLYGPRVCYWSKLLNQGKSKEPGHGR